MNTKHLAAIAAITLSCVLPALSAEAKDLELFPLSMEGALKGGAADNNIPLSLSMGLRAPEGVLLSFSDKTPISYKEGKERKVKGSLSAFFVRFEERDGFYTLPLHFEEPLIKGKATIGSSLLVQASAGMEAGAMHELDLNQGGPFEERGQTYVYQKRGDGVELKYKESDALEGIYFFDAKGEPLEVVSTSSFGMGDSKTAGFSFKEGAGQPAKMQLQYYKDAQEVKLPLRTSFEAKITCKHKASVDKVSCEATSFKTSFKKSKYTTPSTSLTFTFTAPKGTQLALGDKADEQLKAFTVDAKGKESPIRLFAHDRGGLSENQSKGLELSLQLQHEEGEAQFIRVRGNLPLQLSKGTGKKSSEPQDLDLTKGGNFTVDGIELSYIVEKVGPFETLKFSFKKDDCIAGFELLDAQGKVISNKKSSSSFNYGKKLDSVEGYRWEKGTTPAKVRVLVQEKPQSVAFPLDFELRVSAKVSGKK